MRKRILITGGTGFLGRHLALAMKDSHDVVLSGRNNKAIHADLEPEPDHQPIQQCDNQEQKPSAPGAGQRKRAWRGKHR